MKAAAHRNVTLSLPEPLLRKFRVYAAQRNQSMTSLVADAIRKMVDQDSEYEKNKRLFIEGMKNAPRLGTHGKIPWTRDEIHER